MLYDYAHLKRKAKLLYPAVTNTYANIKSNIAAVLTVSCSRFKFLQLPDKPCKYFISARKNSLVLPFSLTAKY